MTHVCKHWLHPCCGICNILLFLLVLDSLDLAEGYLLLRLCYSVDIGQASEF